MSGLPVAHAASGSGPPSRPQSLAVSVPSETAPLAPGASGTIPIRVVNPGSTSVTVRITGQRIQFADEGRVTIAGRDPMWEGRVDFPARPITISAQSYRDVGLTVHVPPRISPDLYFVGFLVTPLPDAARNITYIHQVGSYITIDVPGPRTRTLTADLRLPRFALSSDRVHAKLHVHNVGKAAAMFWGENDTGVVHTPARAPRPLTSARGAVPDDRHRRQTVVSHRDRHDARPDPLSGRHRCRHYRNRAHQTRARRPTCGAGHPGRHPDGRRHLVCPPPEEGAQRAPAAPAPAPPRRADPEDLAETTLPLASAACPDAR